MLSEPFFEELYNRLGWDTENFAAPIVSWIFDMTALPFFWPVSLGMIGLGAGVWLHFLAVTFDRRSAPKKQMHQLSYTIYKVRRDLDSFVMYPQTSRRVTITNPTAPTDETASTRSLLVSLSNFGVQTPKSGPSINVDEARMISEYLATISSFVSNGQKKECQKVAKEFLASIKGERPRLLSRLGTPKGTPQKNPHD